MAFADGLMPPDIAVLFSKCLSERNHSNARKLVIEEQGRGGG
jgi:hypothetical protein